MNQTRIILALLLLAALAIGTGSVLLLGYFLAASSIAVMLVVAGRKVFKRLSDARLGRSPLLRHSPRSVESGRQPDTDESRRAA